MHALDFKAETKADMISSTPPPAHSSRQRPGSACEECRRRKVRCDRQRPQCQVCYESGLECKISTTRLPRGPRKGQLRTLRTRIGKPLLVKSPEALAERVAALERCLADRHPEIDRQVHALLEGAELDYETEDDNIRGISMSRNSTRSPKAQPAGTRSPVSPRLPRPDFVSELMRADLDQLYFDRIQPFVPILQQWRYQTWSGQREKTEAQSCLQYAVWAVAASASTQFCSLRDTFYQEARRSLDGMDGRNAGADTSAVTEQAQAWLLICIYEYLHISALQAWMSAGRCCRLVLGMRLHALDEPSCPVLMKHHESSLIDWTGLEERRRIFWMVFSLDRFISFHNRLPFHMNEQSIATRLPAHEERFQAGQAMVAPYLPELMTRIGIDNASSISPFAECIVLATLCGRVLAHRQKIAVEQLSIADDAAVFDGFWARHQWLHEMFSFRIQALSALPRLDPMTMFTRIVAHTMVLFLHSLLESVSWKTADRLLDIIEYERLCILSAHDVVNLIKLQGQLGWFKVHPLTSIPLMMCTEFFAGHSYLDAAFDGMLHDVMDCLQDLEHVKNVVHGQ